MILALEEEMIVLRRRLERITKTLKIADRINPDACFDFGLNDQLKNVEVEYADVADLEDVIRKLSALSKQGRK